MMDIFIPSPKLKNGEQIAAWLNSAYDDHRMTTPNGAYTHKDEVKVIDWHIISIEGGYQVIAHLAEKDK